MATDAREGACCVLQPWHPSQEFKKQLANVQALSGPFGSEGFADCTPVCGVDIKTMGRLRQRRVPPRRPGFANAEGQTPDALFDALAAGGQEVRWPDFRALFAQLEPSLGEGQLQQLWVTFDTNADGGISREEFKKQLANVQASATAGAAPQARAAGSLQEICARVNDALRRKGQTPDALFDALAAAQIEMVSDANRSVVSDRRQHRLLAIGCRSSTALLGAIRMNREEDKSIQERWMRKHELMRPSLGEGQLQQPAPRGTHSYRLIWK
ncbi:NUDT8 [Symbiodinium sp. CCMP2592]|nr:NUDT8 [Symbiodinium sp. CCMP2592]